MTVPLPSPGDADWIDWAGYVHDRVTDPGRLDDFREGTDPDWTNAFTEASAWSSLNRTPIYLPPAVSAYTTSAPIPLDRQAAFFSEHPPMYADPTSASDAPAVISPTATFPANRGLFEFGTNARCVRLSGLVLDGNNVGSGVHGVVLPGWSGVPDLSAQLVDLNIHRFSGDGIRGGARVIFLRNVFSRHNGGYGINVNDDWYDSRGMWVYCGWNRLGGLNIEGGSLVSFFQCRFERSGQTYADPQNGGANPAWNPTAPGIRLRGGSGSSFIQCDTDANNGPGLDAQIESATPADWPQLFTFISCHFSRDGQGDGQTVDTASTGVKVRGFGDPWAGGKLVSRMRFSDCSVATGVSNDSGDTAYPANPSRGLWLETTELCQWLGGSIFGVNKVAYFGGGAPGDLNWRPYFSLPEQGVTMPAYPETTPFQIPGMLRESGALQRWDGTAWVTV